MNKLVTQSSVIEFDKVVMSCKLLWPILLRNSNTFDNDTCKIWVYKLQENTWNYTRDYVQQKFVI